VVKNAVKDSFTGLLSGKGTHGAAAPAHFNEKALDHIGAVLPEFALASMTLGKFAAARTGPFGANLRCFHLPVNAPQ
jgi:hypothetical protein